MRASIGQVGSGFLKTTVGTALPTLCLVFVVSFAAPATAQIPGQGLLPAPAAVQAPAPLPTEPAPAAPAQPEVKFAGLDSIQQVVGKDLGKAAEIFLDVWNIKILKKPEVTVGTLAGGIVLLGLGYVAAGVISRWVAAKLLTRFHLDKSDIAPVQSLMYYVLLASFTMLSLTILEVPITAFSFLGGALAIGAGFGSQNIVNNFISGLIILVERPIRVGDVVEIDGTAGSVLQIGARSTKIATSGNREMIVPNSKLLETSVINWTLTDDVGGCVVKVGVAYGSPTREVERLLKVAAAENGNIMQDPAPDVVFADFGDDALKFELRFRVNLRQTRKVDVESELRFAIDELFSSRGIVMAYPQRDVHLNVLRPVEVRLSQHTLHAKAA